MRAPNDSIAAPPFLPQLRWVNVKRLRMEQLRGRPVLIEFWDLCRPNSMRTLPYVKAWHERYGGPPPAPLRAPRPQESDDCARAAAGQPDAARPDAARSDAARPDTAQSDAAQFDAAQFDAATSPAPPDAAATSPAPPTADRSTKLQVIGIHSPGFERSRDRKAVLAAVERLGIEYPVMIDSRLEMWREYENLGWPVRYLFGPDGMLFHYHYGEGAYEETELAIQELLGLQRPLAPLSPLRPEDAPGATLAPQSEDREGLYQGPYEAGGVWAVLDGSGTVEVNGGTPAGGRSFAIDGPGAYPLLEHPRHTRGQLSVALGDGVTCIATCFTPGLA